MNSMILAHPAPRWWLGVLAVATVVAASPHAHAQAEQQALVSASETTFANFMRDPDMTWLQRNLGRAKGVLIAPEIVKAGWIFGGSGGRAVLFARDEQSGRWSGPAFYNVGAASVGFQAGISVSETVTLVMTSRGLNSLLAMSIKLGGDVSVAAGPVGAGASSDVTTDFVAFSRSKGVYGGLNLEGGVIDVADAWNQAYYGKSVLPPDILLNSTAHNAHADKLASAIRRAASGERTSSAR